MPESLPNPDPFACQLRVVLREVSPLIWRRLLVRGDSSIANLHATLHLVLGWSDEHLHRFVIHGREYGGAHLGGVPSAMTPAMSGWPISACARASASTSTTSAMAGSTTSGSSRSCLWSPDGGIRSASLAGGRFPRTAAVGHGPSWMRQRYSISWLRSTW